VHAFRQLSKLALFSVLAACERGGDPGPNLLLVIFDTTRADHLSCYGYAKPTTPAVDALARDGVRFDAAYAQSSLTPVSAATVLSGAMPFRHGVRSLFMAGKHTLSPEVASLAELASASGRRTAAFVSARPMGSHYGLSRGFDVYEDEVSESKQRYGIAAFADAAQRPADDTAELALAWLDAHGREPFAALVHFFDAHDPSFVPPREFLAEHVSFELPPGLGRTTERGVLPALRAPENLVELYDAEIRFMDEQLARLLERLRSLGVLDDTLVVVIADHGEAFGEHGVWTHGWLYEEQLRVPLVLSGPGVPRGLALADRVRLVDLLPTLVELLGLSAPEQSLDGVSLAPLLSEGLREGATRAPAKSDVYAEVHHAEPDRLQREREMYSLTVGEWKYVHRPASGAHELFDLAHDPGERSNLYAADAPMARVLALRLQALGSITGSGASLEGMSAEELDRLRKLGYFGAPEPPEKR